MPWIEIIVCSSRDRRFENLYLVEVYSYCRCRNRWHITLKTCTSSSTVYCGYILVTSQTIREMCNDGSKDVNEKYWLSHVACYQWLRRVSGREESLGICTRLLNRQEDSFWLCHCEVDLMASCCFQWAFFSALHSIHDKNVKFSVF